MIESINNERVKKWTKLGSKKYQEESGLFLIEGEHPIEEAFKCGVLREVIILEGNIYPYENSTIVTEEVMRKITSLTSPPKIIGVVEHLQPREEKGRVLLLDRISDPGNLGTIIRSAVAFGIDTIVLSPESVSIYNPKVLRATEGLIFHLNIITEALEDTIQRLKMNGYKVYATDVQNGSLVEEVDFESKTAIVMGSEARGVSPSIRNLCDAFLYIEMHEACESLNVGVATSIILYELEKKLRIK